MTLNPLNLAKGAINKVSGLLGFGEKEDEKEEKKDLDFFSDGDNVITDYTTQQPTIPGGFNPQVAEKKPLHEMITPTEAKTAESQTEQKKTENLSDKDFEEGFKEQDEQPEAEAPEAEAPAAEAPEAEETKKIVPKKEGAKIINKIADSVESFIKHDKPLIDTINDLRECLTALPEDRKYEIIEYIATELANATDAEGNKLFKDATESKQFLYTISTKQPSLRYKLPVEIQKEIKEKTPKIITSLTQRNIRSRGAANKNIYQY